MVKAEQMAAPDTASNAMVKAESTAPQPNINPARSASSIPSKKPTGDSYKTFVTVEVGREKKVFSIHKEVLCFYSDYFRAALNGAFTEGSQGKVSLLQESPMLFDIFNGWLYSRELRDDKDNVGSDIEFWTIVQLWVLGDKYMIPLLQNRVMDVFWQKSNSENVVPANYLVWIYRNTVADSPLRKALIDMLAYKCNMTRFFTENPNHYTTESLADIITVLQNRDRDVPNFTLPKRVKCHYHIHPEGKHC